MTVIQVCRACLAHDTHMYLITNTALQVFYEKITNAKLNTQDGRPFVVCYICYHLLKKCHRFAESAIQAKEVLQQICNSGIQMTKQFVDSIDKIHLFAFHRTAVTHVNATRELLENEVRIKTENEEAGYESCSEDNHQEDTTLYEIKKEEVEETQHHLHLSADSDDEVPLQRLSTKNDNEAVEMESVAENGGQGTEGATAPKKLKPEKNTRLSVKLEKQSSSKGNIDTETHSTKNEIKTVNNNAEVKRSTKKTKPQDINKKSDCKRKYDKCNNKMPTTSPTHIIPSLVPDGTFRQNNNRTTFICDMCGLIVKCNNTLQLHLKSHETVENPQTKITDSLKQNDCKNSNLVRKMNSNDRNKSLKCDLNKRVGKLKKCKCCNKTFSKKDNLINHMRIHTGVKPYKCDHCNKTFSLKHVLNTHIRIHTGDKPYKCDYCNKTFSGKGDLIRHIRIHTGVKPYKCDYCNKTFSRISHLNTHIRIHTGVKPYKCDYCNKTFSRISHLNTHIRIHTRVKPYKCDNCNKTFSQISHLNTHIRIHTGVKPYKCDHCNKTFSQKGDLIRHIRIHTGDKPYKCDHCNKTFSQKHVLNTHIRIHTGDKPYKCDYCNKTFSVKGDLIGHIRIHKGDKPYKCDICNKTFSRKDHFNFHIRIHTGVKPYKCDICNKTFSQKSNFNCHIRIHTGVKPYKCDICNKTFSRKDNFNCHIRIHTGVKPYKCDICNKTFSRKSNFNCHIRIHTGVKP